MDEEDDRPEAQFGAELRLLRQQAGLTVRELASRLHRSHSSIVEWERGARLAPAEAAQQYEVLFELAPGALTAPREEARQARRALDFPPDARHEPLCPYKGLEAFQYDDAALFFGREAQVDEVLERLGRERFFAVIGPSGSGKSSFVRAGLLAGIAAESATGDAPAQLVVLTPGEAPLDELARQLNVGFEEGERLRVSDLRSDPRRLARVTRSGGGRSLVIAVDQFEELFTLCREQTDRRCFVEALMAAWREPSSQVSLIVALRADHYGSLVDYPELAGAVMQHQELLAPMTRGDLQRVIERPAELCHLRLQPGLPQTILDDLTDQPGALPLLSHALFETWKHREVATLTVRGYRDAGGVHGAIAQTAENTFLSLSEGDQAIARSIFLRLTDIGGGDEPVRRRIDRADVATPARSQDARDRVLDMLADARLITIEQDTVVVAHEALLRHWTRLQGWIDTDRVSLLVHRRLTAAAREWDGLGRERAALYGGGRLAEAREWAADHAADLSGLEQDFLTAGHASAKRNTRRLQTVATVLAALVVIATVSGLLARNQRNEARDEAANATSLALAQFSAASLSSRPDVALALALEGYSEAPREEASSAVFRAMQAERASGLRGMLAARDSLFRVAFSPDGKTLATVGGDDGAVLLWDPVTRSQVGRVGGGTDTAIDVAFSPDGQMLAGACDDGSVVLWNPISRMRIARLGGGSGETASVVSDVAFSPDGKTLAAAKDDGTVDLWNPATRERREPLTAGAPVSAVAFSPDGKLLASASSDYVISLWNAATYEPLGELLGHTNAVTALAFSSDGKTLASAGDDNEIHIWDTSTQTSSAVLTGHADSVYDVAFSPDGKTLASGSADNTARLWDPATGARLARLTGHTSEVTGVAFSPDGATLASAGGLDGTVRLWNAAIRTPVTRLTGHVNAVNAVAFNPTDGRMLISGSDDTAVLRWNTRTGKQGRLRSDHNSEVNAVAFSRDGKVVASAGGDGTIALENPVTRRLLGRVGDRGPVNGLAFNEDGKTIGSARADGSIRLWNHVTGDLLGRLTGHTNSVNAAVFSPDGEMLASASDDSAVRLWDPATRKQVRRIAAGRSAINAVAFSPDGKVLVSAGDDRSLRQWNPSTGAVLGSFTGHTDAVNAVAFSPDGRTLASGGDDGTLRVWNVATRRSVAVLTGHTASVYSVAFSPDGKTLASGSDDNTVRLWSMVSWRSSGELRETVCDMLVGGLSRSEWARYAPGTTYRRSCAEAGP